MKNKDTESVGDNSLESTEIPALECQEPFEREKEDATRDEYEKVDSENPSSETKMNSADETLREGSGEQIETIDTETMDDSCQIIPFGNEGSEDAQDSPDEDLGEDFASECSLEDTHLDHQILAVDHSNKEETAPNLTRETSSENSGLSIGDLAILETNSANEHAIKEDTVDSKVSVVPDNNGEVASDSLDDPYVLGDRLPTANEILYAGREMQEADIQNSSSDFREGENTENENHLLSIDRKNIVTRTRSHSGKVPGYVPETVPEETGTDTELQSLSTNTIIPDNVRHSFCWAEGKPIELARTLPAKPRRFILYPRSYSVEDYNRLNRTDELSLPYVISSSGSFSQRNHLTSSGVSTPSSVVDIPPPFELACITKKPITKSSPSLLIDSESPDKYCKKKKSSFKKFLTLKFKKKAENKVHVDVHVSSSRSSSESSYHGPSRVMELDRRSLSSSPQLLSRTANLRASESPTVLFYKDGKRKGTPKMFSRSVSRVESFEDRSRPPFMPLPLTKPRSISFPNADTSDYENIPAMNSDYENIQIPPRRPTRAGTFTEFFEDPSRALSAANENDGYVDMSSFAAFENNKQQTTNQETESAYTEPYKVCPISVIPLEDVTSDEEQKSSEDEDSNQGDPNIIHKKEGQSRAQLVAQELVSSEKVNYAVDSTLIHSALAGCDDSDHEETKLKEGLKEIPEIYNLHQEILGELEEKVLNWEEHQKVADIFLSRESGFNHHTTYIMQFDRNLALLDDVRLKSSQLDTVIKEFEVKCLHFCVSHTFLILFSPTDYLNNLCPDSENLQKLVHIEHSVKGQSNLLQPGRVFLKEGTLMKVSGKNRHPRHLFLMNDVLLYTYPQKDGKYRLKNTLAVSGMKVSRPATKKAQNVLKIEYAENCLTLSASSCSERDEWYSCISRSIPEDHGAHSGGGFHNSVELRERLGMSLGERPPTLVPVSHVMMCMSCGCDFKLTLRRHHCHACGKIICRNCSRNKYPLKYLKDRLAKVCDGCYTELKRLHAALPGPIFERPISISFPTSSSRFSGSAFSSVFHNIHYSSFKRQKKIPSALLEDKVATESMPLLGFTIVPEKEDRNMDAVFHLYHKQTLFYSFRAEDNNSAQRY
uniref:FYVE, RhoGEF and PH domain containing 5 n=1 Tax=Naja naja TaxID=35670 RepID=A0A8C6YLT4_NAJNA